MRAFHALVAAPWVLLFLSASVSEAQFAQQGAKLVGAGASGAPNQAGAVSVSADGNTAIAGGFADSLMHGAAWVYARSGGVWAQQGPKLVGTGAVGAAGQGISVALSADGNTALVSGHIDNSNLGATWVFTRSGGVWSQQGPKLVGTGAVGAPQQGYKVALSADGNTALVGGYNDNAGMGAAWVFVRSGGVWSQQGAKLVGSGAVGSSPNQGYSVGISGDGNTAILGGYNDNNGTGAAWVFVRSGGMWSQQGAKLVGTGGVGFPQQGSSVSISESGNTAIVGGFGDNGGVGAFWVFELIGGVWSQQGAKLVGTGNAGSAQEGAAVSVSASGDTAIVGGPVDNNGAGAVWIFVRSGGVWSQQSSKRVGTGAVGNANQGIAVSMSGDGKTAVVGGNADNSGKGAAWMFGEASPIIASIMDVPNDQGGQVRLRWQMSFLDAPGNGAAQIVSYGIWRKLPPATATLSTRVAPARVMNDTLGTSYDFIATVPAVQSPSYNIVAPTLDDSSTSGIHRFTFLLTAHTSDPNVFFISAADSGYSVDNLSPPTPTPFTAAYVGAATHLHWGANPAPDFATFRLYRGTSAGFVPDAGNLVIATADTGYADPGAAGNYYKLSAVDLHGNESSFATLGPGQTLTVPGGGTALAFALRGVEPNPTHGGPVRVAFTLPQATPAQLELLDVSGRQVLVREVGSLGAGQHTVELSVRRRLAPGVYLIRLTQSGRCCSTRAAVLE